MCAAKLKLFYFDGRGRAEWARLIAAAGNLDFENVRFKQDQWPEYKPNAPLGQAPYLEVGDVTLGQSITICRYLAKEANLAGKTNLDQAKADMVVDEVTDQFLKLFRPNKTDEDKKEHYEKCLKEYPSFLETLEKRLKAEGGKHFAGNELTWADIVVFDFLTTFKDETDPLQNMALVNLGERRKEAGDLSQFPLLADLVTRVAENPGLKKWMQTRPSNAEEKF